MCKAKWLVILVIERERERESGCLCVVCGGVNMGAVNIGTCKLDVRKSSTHWRFVLPKRSGSVSSPLDNVTVRCTHNSRLPVVHLDTSDVATRRLVTEDCCRLRCAGSGPTIVSYAWMDRVPPSVACDPSKDFHTIRVMSAAAHIV